MYAYPVHSVLPREVQALRAPEDETLSALRNNQVPALPDGVFIKSEMHVACNDNRAVAASVSIRPELQLDLCNLDAVKKEPENVHVKNEPVLKNEPMHLVQRAFASLSI